MLKTNQLELKKIKGFRLHISQNDKHIARNLLLQLYPPLQTDVIYMMFSARNVCVVDCLSALVPFLGLGYVLVWKDYPNCRGAALTDLMSTFCCTP